MRRLIWLDRQAAREVMAVLSAPILLFILESILQRLGQDTGILVAGAALLIVVLSQYIRTSQRRLALAVLCSLSYGVMALSESSDFLSVLFIMLLLFCTGRLSGTLRQRIDEEHRQSTMESERRRLLGELNTKLLTARGMDEIRRQLLRSVYEVCGHSAVYFTCTSEGLERICSYPDGLILYDQELQAVPCAAKTAQITGVGTDCFNSSAFRCYPIHFGGMVSDVVAVLFGAAEQDPALIQFTDQLLQRGAIALERQRLVDVQQEIITEKQVEQVRANFLRAISHDLRSPLAAIMGACSALEQVPDTPANSHRLVTDIREESEWLTHMVENLLSVTRVNTNSPKLNLSAEAVEEIVGEAAYKCKTRFPELSLKVAVPNQVVILQMDATLITQVILNLVENAVKYGGPKHRVELTVVCEGKDAVFSVRDYGEGIPPEKINALFTDKGPREDDSHHSLGIGLSICRTIVNAHGGKIWAENCPDNGAKFSFTLPLEESAK